ncbi:FadR family transcriptional regulator [bacterium]|nr:FadR family transcriptional regulator [candidate division CSSED10-310 bacterium]
MTDRKADKKLRIADTITEDLLAKILGGEIKPGDKLAPERELAVIYNTNRNTLREAIRNLQTLNLLDVRHGDGLRIKDFRTAGELHLLPQYFKHCVNENERLAVFEEVLSFRKTMLIELVGEVASNRSQEDLAALKRIIDHQHSQSGDPGKMLLSDVEFNKILVRASHNQTAYWIFNTLVKLYQEIIADFSSLGLISNNYLDFLDKLYDAIRTRDAKTARSVIEQHLISSDKMVLTMLRVL